MNPFLRLVLGPGRLPDQLRADLTANGLVLLAEGLSGSVTYRHFRAPGQRANWRKQAVSGAVAISTDRLLVWAGRFRHIDVPLADPVRATIEARADRPDRILFAYDAGTTNPSRSGRVEVRLRTADAPRIERLLAL
ncbi:hypothetical protein [Phytohabitans houttuyneae]|uniref:Uncharacterized protein n=1 Tax=Phytohabitans houttuyneae TaxID=1076126 RepID=A0A6V8K142_9ACTN|nr:hypothetical protein [Phytohabitans houttuyneae]GFJ75889.1 hypothetical protein Phou_000690 [Phytohabitans houttuyneae]